MKSAVLLLLVLCYPQLAGAADMQVPELFPSALKMIGSLLLMLGMLLGMYFLFKKGSILSSGGKGEIQILDIKHLGGRKSVCLLQVKGRQMLVGVSQDGIGLLSQLDREGDASRFEQELRQKKSSQQ